MRHSRASTTTDVYMQSLKLEVRSAINLIHKELTADGTRGAVPPHGGAVPKQARPGLPAQDFLR